MKTPDVTLKVLGIIIEQLRVQNEKGLTKYGTTIDEAKSGDYEWNVMVIEELVDGIQYVVKENLRLKEIIEIMEERNRYQVDSQYYIKYDDKLKFLRGE